MILSVKDQNKALAAAAKQPKDTSNRSITANKYAARIASSKSPSQNVVSESRQKIQASGQSDKIKGSFEGLDSSPSTHIQMAGAGYDSKKNQIARYSKNTSNKIDPKFNLNSFKLETNSSIINNYSSSTMKDSSSDRLRTVVRNNMMFK